jgi:Flp pilus assembly protein TadG
MLVLFGVIEFGYALWQWNTMTLAVQQSGRYAMINYARCGIGGIVGCAISQMQTVLTNAAVCTTPAAGQMCVSATAPTGTPPTMTLTAIYNVNLVALLPPFTITSQTVVPID